MCSNSAWSSRGGLMEPALFTHIVSQLKSHGVGTATIASAQGEPFLHPRALDFLEEGVAAGLQIAVSTNGRSPAFAGWVRRQLESRLETAWADALRVAAEVRDELHAAGHSTEVPGWRDAFDAGFVDLVAAGDHEGAKALLRTHLGAESAA
jgi:organic radical activating enzyme